MEPFVKNMQVKIPHNMTFLEDCKMRTLGILQSLVLDRGFSEQCLPKHSLKIASFP